MVSNIKCSLIFEVDLNWERDLKLKCDILEIPYHKNGNMLIVKKDFSLTIIKKKIFNSKIFLHVNLSGVKNFKLFEQSIEKVRMDILPENWVLVKLSVDNITYSKHSRKTINLREFKSHFPQARYNIDRFPGLFIKSSHGGTCLLFKSGKINVVGCKSKKSAKLSWREIYQMLESVNT